MKKIEKIISMFILGLLAPVVLMLVLWWGSLPYVIDNDELIMFLALGGFMAGILLDFTILHGFIFKLFKLPLSALVGVEIFYSIMIYGFFMGLPVFNSFVGILGSYITARNGIIRKKPMEEILKNTRYINRISTILLFALCVCSAVLALRESTICLQIKGMLNLPFDVTIGTIWMLILAGGSFLIIFQYFFARLVSKQVIKKANLEDIYLK